jgi:hypothetical protein
MGLMAACMLGVMTFAMKRATAAPEAVVRGFLAAATAGDYTKAHSYLSSPLRAARPLAVWQAEAQRQQDRLRVRDATFRKRSIDGDAAELSGTLTLAAGGVVPASFQLLRERGEWRLDSYQIGDP